MLDGSRGGGGGLKCRKGKVGDQNTTHTQTKCTCMHVLTITAYFSQEFQKGLGILEENNVPFDLSINDPILKHIPKIAAKFPNLRMVIDHLAKPEIPKGEEYFITWKNIIIH